MEKAQKTKFFVCLILLAMLLGTIICYTKLVAATPRDVVSSLTPPTSTPKDPTIPLREKTFPRAAYAYDGFLGVQNFGGGGDDFLHTVLQTGTNFYAIGTTTSTTNSGRASDFDALSTNIFVAKLDHSGKLEVCYTFQTARSITFLSAIATPSGLHILATTGSGLLLYSSDYLLTKPKTQSLAGFVDGTLHYFSDYDISYLLAKSSTSIAVYDITSIDSPLHTFDGAGIGEIYVFDGVGTDSNLSIFSTTKEGIILFLFGRDCSAKTILPDAAILELSAIDGCTNQGYSLTYLLGTTIYTTLLSSGFALGTQNIAFASSGATVFRSRNILFLKDNQKHTGATSVFCSCGCKIVDGQTIFDKYSSLTYIENGVGFATKSTAPQNFYIVGVDGFNTTEKAIEGDKTQRPIALFSIDKKTYVFLQSNSQQGLFAKTYGRNDCYLLIY